MAPDDGDCTIFYSCRDKKTKQTCPPKLVYDGRREMCDYPWKVPGCGGNPTIRTTQAAQPETPGTTTTPTTTPTTTTTTTPTTTRPTTTGSSPTTVSVRTTTASTVDRTYCSLNKEYAPDTKDCSVFYSCKALRTPLQCQPGLLFDATRQLCDYSFRVRCTQIVN